MAVRLVRRLLLLTAWLGLGACSLTPKTASPQFAIPLSVTAPGLVTPAAAPVVTTAAPPGPTPVPLSFPTCQPNPAPPPDFAPASIPLTPASLIAGAAGGANPSLRPLADQRGLYIGVATDPSYLRNPEYSELLASQFNMLTPENVMKWEVIHPAPDRYDFSGGDALVNFARSHGMAVHAHTLAWDGQQPPWLTGGNFGRDEWIQILCRHIKTVVGRYRGQVYSWDVVNEPFDDKGRLSNTLWMRKIGPEYIPMAFQWAHEADPQAILVLNETRAEGLNAKSQAVYALASALLQRGIPIDAIGMQMHVSLWGPPSAADLAVNMRRLAALGLQVQITEMDVRTQYVQDGPAQKLHAQAETYRQAIAACLNTPGCTTFITWGLTDAYSWIPGYTGHPDMPLLFDENSRPKPAYDAVLEELARPAAP